MTSTEGASARQDGDGKFSVQIRPEPSARKILLRVAREPSAEILLRGYVNLAFDGRSPVGPGHDRRVTEDGWIPSHIFTFLWDLASTCRRLTLSEESRETVSLPPTSFVIVLERKQEIVGVRLIRTDVRGPPLAETHVSTQELARACFVVGSPFIAWMTATNPELRGNTSIQRLREVVGEVGKASAGQLS